MPSDTSRKPLAEKLGIKAGFVVIVINPPQAYRRLLGRLPDRVTIRTRLDGRVNMIHAFVRDRSDLEASFDRWKGGIPPDGSLWICWPKRSAGVPTDLTEDVIRSVALAHGLVDVKVCAIDETWSGLKLVYRLADRAHESRKGQTLEQSSPCGLGRPGSGEACHIAVSNTRQKSS